MKKKLLKTNQKNLPEKGFLNLFLISILLAFSNLSTAQKAWSIEVRPGVNFATKNLADANLKTGFGIEGTINYRFLPHLGAYAGWGWNKFAAGQSFAGAENDFEETGYTFGLQFIHPFGNDKFSYLIEAGGIFNHIEVENSSGDIIADSGHGLGCQAGFGLLIPVSERFSLIPAVRYRALSRSLKIGESKTAVDLNYVSGGIGLSWSF